MTTHRRRFLRLCGVAGIGAIAGCSDSFADGTLTADQTPSTQQAKLAADDGDNGDNFGQSVALSSDCATALIAAPMDEDPNGSRAGSSYVFE